MEPGLYVVGTPIGNLQDITLRALETLKGVAAILAEDTRLSRHLLDRFEIRVPLISCHKFSEMARSAEVVGRIRSGQALALVTDSGMPAVSDPGARVVNACREAGVPVFIIPGPSAVTSAMALCGFEGTGFLFEGFLSHKSATRVRRLKELADFDVPVVLFESPFRVMKLLNELEEVMPERPVFIGRELTKKFEESLRGTAADLKKRFENRAVKGEFVVVLAPAPHRRRQAEADAPDAHPIPPPSLDEVGPE